MRDRAIRLITGFTLVLIAAQLGRAQSSDDLRSLSMEDLLNLEVTTVSRTPTTRSMTAAAVHLITQDEILRS
jgi:iron complex outermembrane receptor protein